MTNRAWYAGLGAVVIVYLHDALPYLTTLPRVNVDEPWLIERGYQVMRTGIPSQPMLGLDHAYLLQVGYGYLLAIWMSVFGVEVLQARLLAACLGLGIVVMVAWIGRRQVGPAAGLAAALLLAVDSNFLGGARSARTDIPSVFFVVCAVAADHPGRRCAQTTWFACAGASLGLAMLCHGNAFWAGIVLLAWYFLDYGRRALAEPYGYAVIAGALATLGPYLAVVIARWHDVQVQIGNFAADRVPGWRPSFLLQQIAQEPLRYRDWYFGLVTAAVPNPLLRAFQLAIVAGFAVAIYRTVRPRAGEAAGDTTGEPRGPLRLLVLAAGGALIFAALINNKVPVYLPHVMIGFALVAGLAVDEAIRGLAGGRFVTHRATLMLAFVVLYGGAGIAYYEKWYSTALKSELVSYESTERTLRALVPDGPKYIFASPQFWTPFHAEAGTTFYSFAAAQPIAPSNGEGPAALAGTAPDRPIVLLVDELQWLPELVGATSSTSEWQRNWITFIEERCALDAVAYGTAHGTLASYRCTLAGGAPGRSPAIAGTWPRIVGGATEYRVGECVARHTAADLARWTRYDDPRRTPASQPDVRLDRGGLRISGTGWPGIVATFAATPGDAYLVSPASSGARGGDLLYLGTWQQPQVRSLSGAASAGIPAPLAAPRWFPRERAFRATSPQVRMLVYSEAPRTDFVISSLDVYRLQPAGEAPAR
jgi:4-amino-4-deoxy-L-arabinose transferase-like glycosyltransferase